MNEALLDLSGEYRGQAEGHNFRLNLIQSGCIVEATVDWLHEVRETMDHVRLIGKVFDDHVEFRYWRNAFHPNRADKGEARMYPTDQPDTFTGEWFSFDVEERQEDWILTLVSSEANLVKGVYPSYAEIPIGWAIISPTSSIAIR